MCLSHLCSINIFFEDWCGFGHKFNDRCGHGMVKETQERSPIFVQWLDMVYQVQSQFPDAFEYDDRVVGGWVGWVEGNGSGQGLGVAPNPNAKHVRAKRRMVSLTPSPYPHKGQI